MRIERKRFFSIIIFASIVLGFTIIAVLYMVNIVNWGNYPDFGFAFRTTTGISQVGMVTENGHRAGLQVGDRFFKVNGKEFINVQTFRAAMNREPGQQNTYLLEREGKQFELSVPNIPLGFKRAFGKSSPPFILGICYALIGILVFLMKPFLRPSWIFFIFNIIIGFYIAFLFRVGRMNPNWLETFHLFVYTFAPAVFIHLTLSFPEERNLLRKHPFLQSIPYLASAILFLIILRVTPTMTGAPRIFRLISTLYMAIGVLVFLLSAFQLWLRSKSEITKIRSKLILLGSAIAVLLPLSDFLSGTILNRYILPGFNYYLPFFIIFPMFLGYSIVKHDLFDIDTLIKRTYGYILTTGALGGIYGIIVLISNMAFGGFEFAKSPIFPLIFILTVVFLFNPIRNRVQRFIDRVFYRLEYDYQETVGKISETMRSLLNLDEIGKNLINFALQPMFVDTGSIMLLDPEKKAYECLIQDGRKEDWKMRKEAEGAVPEDRA
ncbi:MAG: hypothetical protein HKO68_16790, partial [Desulfobacterales bacterium]|nr:hypothetical protein [Desulfobacterales bacterium]